MATQRDAGALGIRLLGLYYAAHTVALSFGLLFTPFVMSPAAFSSNDPFLAASISSGVGSTAVAVVALFGANRIADALFPSSPLLLGIASSRRDLLVVGVAIVGVWIAADGVVALLRAAGAFAYYVQQDVPSASLARSWPQVFANVTTLVAGIALALSAPRVAARLDRAR